MLIATDPLSLLFIGCFLFGLLFLLVTAVLGNLGHGHVGTQGISHHVGVHVGGHVSHVVSHGIAHTVGQGVRTAPSTQQAASHTAQGDGFSVLSYLNPTSVVLFLLGFGFFGYVFHNTAHLILPLTLVFAGVSGIIIAGLMLIMLARVFGDSEGA